MAGKSSFEPSNFSGFIPKLPSHMSVQSSPPYSTERFPVVSNQRVYPPGFVFSLLAHYPTLFVPTFSCIALILSTHVCVQPIKIFLDNSVCRIHSFRTMSYVSTYSSEAISTYITIWSLLVQQPAPSHFLKTIQYLLTSSSSSSRHYYPSLCHSSSDALFRRQFLRKIDQSRQPSFFLLSVGYCSSLSLYVTLHHLSHDPSILLQHHISKLSRYF